MAPVKHWQPPFAQSLVNTILGLVAWHVAIFVMLPLTGLSTLWKVLTKKNFMKRGPSPRPIPHALESKEWERQEVKLESTGLDLVYHTTGQRKDGKGKDKPLMLFLHGFPECWYSWRFQLRHFKDDYFVVAPNLRGYGYAHHSTERKDYTLDILTGDVVDLVHGLGYEKCVLVSHDWGGVIGWQVALRHPEVVSHNIVMNCPHPELYANGGIKQLLASWYIIFFRLPWIPEFNLADNDYKFLCVTHSNHKAGLKNKENVDQEVTEVTRYYFTENPSAPLNYYRNLPAPHPKAKLQMPTLLIWGTGDPFLLEVTADNLSSMCATSKTVKLEGLSHWVQQDDPQRVNEEMAAFLR